MGRRNCGRLWTPTAFIRGFYPRRADSRSSTSASQEAAISSGSTRFPADRIAIRTPAVLALREATGLPGMAVLQFAFGGGSDNFYLPHNLRANCVVYPGTHDNDTTLGWYGSADEKTRDHVRRYLRVNGQDISGDFLRTAYASVCNLAIVAFQDLLGLGSAARFNSPGQPQGNWAWRFRSEELAVLQKNSAGYLRELAALYRR